MSRLSLIHTLLPAKIYSALARRVARAQRGNNRENAAWLRKLGFTISKTTIHRTFQPHERELELIRRAQFLRAVERNVTAGEALLIVALGEVAAKLQRRSK